MKVLYTPYCVGVIMANDDTEMSKNEKKIQLIEMFIKTEKKLPAHIKSALRALVKSAKNDMDNFDADEQFYNRVKALIFSYFRNIKRPRTLGRKDVKPLEQQHELRPPL